MQDDSVRAVAGFLLDAARADVSIRTVTQVLRHWAAEGVTSAELLAAVAIAREGAGREHRRTIEQFEHTIRSGLHVE